MMHDQRRFWQRTLIGSLLVLVCGCPDNGGGGSDAGEGGITLLDQRVDRAPAPDQALDAPLEAAGDAPPPDVGDLGVPVDALPTKATVLYTVATDTDSFGLWTVSTDGTAAPTPVPGWSGFIDFDPLMLTGLDENPPVRRGVARVTAEAHADFQGVELPADLGHLFYFHRKLLGTSGLLRVKPDGSLEVLVEVPGLYTDTLSGYLALSGDGKTGAMVQSSSKLLLFRTDGTTLPGGASYLDVTGSAGPSAIKPQSVTIAGDWVHCVGPAASGSGDALYRAPADGSGTLAAVALPQSAGSTPISIGEEPLASADGKLLILTAGASSVTQDVYALDVASGTATNLTKDPGQLAAPGARYGIPTGGLMAISPGSKLVGFVRYDNGVPEVHVAHVDGSGATLVTSDTWFQAAVSNVLNLVFADDDRLLFMAGVTTNQLDVYQWEEAAAQATNLTSAGSTPPFSGFGVFAPRAVWTSPNGKRLYWVEYDSTTQVGDLRGLELATGTLLSMTQGATLSGTASSFAACPTSSALYFVARPSPSQNNNELWALDQDVGTKATRLTSLGTHPLAYWYIFDLALSADCSRLAFSAGGSFNLRQIHAVSPPKTGATRVTLVPKHMDRSIVVTPDSATVVFSSGGSEGAATLKAAALVPSAAPVTLDPKPGVVHIFAVY